MSNRPSFCLHETRIGRHFILLFGFIAFLPCYSQQMPKAVVFDFQPIGVDETTKMTASELLRNELTNTGRLKVIKGEGFCATAEEAVEKARGLGGDKAVIGNLNQLGEKIIVFASLIDVRTGEVEFSDQLVSVFVEDLDVVLKRLAKGLVEKKKVEETAEVGMIIEKEREEPRRRKSFLTYGVKAGYMLPIMGGYGGHTKKMFTADLLAWYENPSFIVEPLAGISISGSSQDVHGDISIYRPLSRTDFAPYLGGGIGIHFVGCDNGDWNHGFALSLGGGVMGFRTYDFRIILDLKYSVVWAELLEEHGQDAITLTIGTTYGSKGGVGELVGLLGLAGGAVAGVCCLGCLLPLAF